LRARGSSVAVDELACELLAVAAPIDRDVARRVVAAALGRPAASLPERLDARTIRPPEEVAVVDVPLARAAFAVIDLETTGLSPQLASILEIGAVHVIDLTVGECFETLVRPPAPLSRAIADLTGIDDAMVADAPRPLEALGAFRRWLDRAGPIPFVAHNARFDAGFVERAFDAHGFEPLPLPVLCTQRLARRLLPEVGRYNLDSVCAHFGIRNPARPTGCSRRRRFRRT
jgi:DNA polymerase-3 subunit epsilon